MYIILRKCKKFGLVPMLIAKLWFCKFMLLLSEYYATSLFLYLHPHILTVCISKWDLGALGQGCQARLFFWFFDNAHCLASI